MRMNSLVWVGVLVIGGVVSIAVGCAAGDSSASVGGRVFEDGSARGRASSRVAQPDGRETLGVDPLDAIDAGNVIIPMIERFRTDAAALWRSQATWMSAAADARRQTFLTDWQTRLEAVDFDALPHQGKVDFLLFRNLLAHDKQAMVHERRRLDEISPLIPFKDAIVSLEENRRAMEAIDGQGSASTLVEIKEQIEQATQAIRDEELTLSATAADRAVARTHDLRRMLGEWHAFYAGYDPLFTWWTQEPFEETSAAMDEYASFVRKELVGVSVDDEDALIGDPIGNAALLDELAFEMIPYSPEELLAIAEAEFAWCEAERLKATREMGFGDDWRAALEHVKGLHVEPGEQPEMIREQAIEALAFLDDNELVTVPDLCREIWRIQMMSPQRQLYTPYFTGGEVISVAFPTDGMTHEQKMMSMRGNNRHFARATVHHELMPGHHLQGYMNARHRTYRRGFSTPFWGEGWALYWEMLFWDMDFQQSPEDRMGMLFWRSHRCARIIFSLSYHLEKMTAEEAIDFLIERVGHERKNATAEVRRSIAGGYGPLYQAAYMLGGLQFRAMHKELVESGIMTNREFHDAILRNNSIPVEMVRAILTGQELTPNFESSWRFYEDLK
jgi:Bacterial protein of unknown function (DUF885)